MPTTKMTKKTGTNATTVTNAKRTRPRSSKAKTIARTPARRGQDASGYILPTAAVLGTGALATAGYILRDQIVKLVHGVIEDITVPKQLRIPNLLALAGMERRRSFVSSAIPEVGGFILGVASGAALTYWLAPKLGLTREPDGELASSSISSDARESSEPREPVNNITSMPSAHASS